MTMARPPDGDAQGSGRSESPSALPGTVRCEASETGYPGARGKSWEGDLPATLPAVLGRYTLDKLLGRGGMGAVYLAHDTELERPVALKIPIFTAGEDSELQERFLREARAAGSLIHPNICPVYDVGRIDGVPFLSMAFIEGQTLAALLRSGGRVPVRQAVTAVRTLALALHEAHERGIIHRDLKPANIIINAKKQPVVMDFGLARHSRGKDEERLTQEGALMGTPAYMPPEQVAGNVRAMGPCSDIYSLGVILYELLAGRLPFEGPIGPLMAQILSDEPPSPRQFRPEVDPNLEAICRKAMAKKPVERHASMKEFAAALTTWLKAAALPPTHPVPAEPATNPGAGAELNAFAEWADAPTPAADRLGRRDRTAWQAILIVGGLLLAGGAAAAVYLGARRADRDVANRPAGTVLADLPTTVESFAPPASIAKAETLRATVPSPAASPAQPESPPAVKPSIPVPQLPVPPAPAIDQSRAKDRPRLIKSPDGLKKPDAETRQPIPKGTTLNDAQKWAAGFYKLADAAKKPRAAQLELAATLRSEAQKLKDNPARRYALLREARRLAIQNGDTAAAMAAVTELARDFQENGPHLTQETLNEIAKVIAKPGADGKLWRQVNREFVEAAIGAANEAVAAEQFLGAVELLQLAAKALPATQSITLKDNVDSRLTDAQLLLKEQKALRNAQEKLLSDPTDADASAIVGKYLGLSQGEWDKAVALLAQGSDAKWKALAGDDLAAPATPAQSIDRAEAWHKAALAEPGRARLQTLVRARYWLEQALPDLDGAARAAAEKKLQLWSLIPDTGKMKVAHDHNLTDPRSGWFNGEKSGTQMGYANGRWFMKRSSNWSVHGHGRHAGGPIAFQLVGRVTKRDSDGWHFALKEEGTWTYHFYLRLDGQGVLHVELPHDPAKTLARPTLEIHHPAVKPGGETNAVLVVMSGRQFEIYVNGIAVAPPQHIDRDVPPCDLMIGLGADGSRRPVEVEFERFTVWSVEGLPSLETRSKGLQ